MGYYPTETASAPNFSTAKNRVWGFFGKNATEALRTCPESLEAHWENYARVQKTASGVPYWPSRDPIGERGGMNLYGFVGSAPSEACRVLRGESPRRKSSRGGSPRRQELAARIVSSLAGVKEEGKTISTIEQHNRSVDRESHRPQGGCTSPKQFSLVRTSNGGRRCFLSGSQKQGCAIGKCPVTPSGSKSVACGKRHGRNLGDPWFSRATKKLWAGRESQLHGG
jgi:hypothetical protein